MRKSNLTEGLRRLFEGFDDAFQAASHSIGLGVGGVGFECRSNDAAYLRQAAHAVTTRKTSDTLGHRLLIDTRGARALSFWPKWSEQFFNEREVEAELAQSPYRLHYFDELDFWQFYDRSRNRGIQLLKGPDMYPPWDPGSPLRNLLHWGLLESGIGFLHAGTLSAGESGVLLAGAGGSGKSGTVAAGLLNGLSSVGDDYVAVQVADTVHAFPAFTLIKQDLCGLARLGADMGSLSKDAPNWQGKFLIRLDALSTDANPEQIRVKALCLPKVMHGDRTVFRRAGQREAFLALAPSGITQIPSARPEMFALCARLSRQLPAWHVELGTDPAEISDAFRGFFAGDGA